MRGLVFLGAFLLAGASFVVSVTSAQALRSRGAVNVPPRVSPIRGELRQAESATHYTVLASDPGGDALTVVWALVAPRDDDRCDNRGLEPPIEHSRSGGPRVYEFVWRHGNHHGCDHRREGQRGHRGVVSVFVTDGRWLCRAEYGGTVSGVGARAACERRGLRFRLNVGLSHRQVFGPSFRDLELCFAISTRPPRPGARALLGVAAVSGLGGRVEQTITLDTSGQGRARLALAGGETRAGGDLTYNVAVAVTDSDGDTQTVKRQYRVGANAPGTCRAATR